MKYNVDASHKSSLLGKGQGTFDVKISRAKTQIGSFRVSNKNDGENHLFNVETFAENKFLSNLTVTCTPKDERVEIDGFVQAPPQSGPERLLKIEIIGKAANDKPGQRTSGVTFDLKLNGVKDTQNAILFKNTNRWEKTQNNLKIASE